MPANFPLPCENAAYAAPLFFEKSAEEFVVSRTIYDDNGADYKLQSGGSGKITFIFKFDGLTTAEAAVHDAWVATMFYSEDEGSAYGANLRDHTAGDAAWTSTAGTLYANVHIAPGGFKKSHEKAWIQSREYVLEKRP